MKIHDSCIPLYSNLQYLVKIKIRIVPTNTKHNIINLRYDNVHQSIAKASMAIHNSSYLCSRASHCTHETKIRRRRTEGGVRGCLASCQVQPDIALAPQISMSETKIPLIHSFVKSSVKPKSLASSLRTYIINENCSQQLINLSLSLTVCKCTQIN